MAAAPPKAKKPRKETARKGRGDKEAKKENSGGAKSRQHSSAKEAKVRFPSVERSNIDVVSDA